MRNNTTWRFSRDIQLFKEITSSKARSNLHKRTNINLCAVSLILAMVGCATSNRSVAQTTMTDMNYHTCLLKINEMEGSYKAIGADVFEVNTGSDLNKKTRICTSDETIVVTCSKTDNKMTIEKSENLCH